MPLTRKQNIALPALLKFRVRARASADGTGKKSSPVGSPSSTPGAFHYKESLYQEYKHSLGITQGLLSADSSEGLKGDVMSLIDSIDSDLNS